MSNTTDASPPVVLDPPPKAPDEISAAINWISEYADVGDPVTAVIHLRHLRQLESALKDCLAVLKSDVVKEFGRGAHHIDGAGAFKVHRGAKKYIVAKPSDGDPVEYRRLLRDVIAKVPEGEDPLPVFERVWPMGPGDCRWSEVKKLGLDPNDYRRPDGYSESVELL